MQIFVASGSYCNSSSMAGFMVVTCKSVDRNFGYVCVLYEILDVIADIEFY